jgi:hypothetical protein
MGGIGLDEFERRVAWCLAAVMSWGAAMASAAWPNSTELHLMARASAQRGSEGA